MLFSLATLALLPMALALPTSGRLASIKRSTETSDANKFIVKIKDNTVDPANRRNWLDRIFTESGTVGISSVDEDALKVKWSTNVFNGVAGRFTPEQLETIRAQDEVAWIEQDITMKTSAVVQLADDATWGVSRISTGPLSLQGLDDSAKIYPYFADETAGTGIDVYVLDTGIRETHVDFGGRATFLATFGPGVEGQDLNGHGTHVAGTIVGTKFGVAKNAAVFGVKIFGDDGSGDVSDIISGLDLVITTAAASGKPSVVNMSLGGPAAQALDDAVVNTIGAGIHVVLAAGNEAQDANNVSPARVQEAIVVGATDINDAVADFSNFGSPVDVFGPGVNVISAAFDSDDGEATLSGTSMACPHVAGLAALILGERGQMAPAELETLIRDTSIKGAIQNLPDGTLDGIAFNSAFDPALAA